jgi:Cys-rich protein (TIGR01571 family)
VHRLLHPPFSSLSPWLSCRMIRSGTVRTHTGTLDHCACRTERPLLRWFLSAGSHYGDAVCRVLFCADSLFGCLDNCGVCLCSCACPCIQYGRNVRTLGDGDFLTHCCLFFLCMPICAACLIHAPRRTELRNKYRVKVRDTVAHRGRGRCPRTMLCARIRRPL